MSAIHERHRNNVKAGIFVSLAIILALATMAVLKNAWVVWLQPRNQYAVTFSVKTGIQTLAKDSTVRIGGLEMGSVERVVIEDLVDDGQDNDATGGTSGPDQPFQKVVVFFTLDNKVPLYSNATAIVKGALIGSDAWIEITDVGHESDQDADGQPDGSLLIPNRTDDSSNWLRGTDAGTMLAGLLGPESAQETKEIITNVRDITANVNRDYSEIIHPTLTSAQAGVEDFKNIMESAGQNWEQWATTVDATLTNVLESSQSLEDGLTEAREFVANADSTIDRVNNAIDDNRQSIDEIVANINSASADVRDVADRIASNIVQKVEDLLASGQEGVDSFVQTARRIELDYDALSPDLRDTMANVQIASAELALATTEIRSSPWRLLYRPNADELEYENLYFAATKFTLAASELKVAAQTVDRAVANHREFLNENPTRLEELQQLLSESMDRYTQAQEELLSILQQTPQQ